MVIFSSFVLESGYEQFYIYDGTSTSATLIGRYTGVTITPGTVIATNASGALTFRFTSDYTVNKAGWAAAVSCVSSNYFTITCAPVTGGTVLSDLSSALEGTTVTLTAVPDSEHHFGSWNVTDDSGNAITVTDNTFIMPAGNVTASAIFLEGASTVTHYELVTSIDELNSDDIYIIANTNNGKAFAIGEECCSSSYWGNFYYRNAVSVTATNGTIPFSDKVVELSLVTNSNGYYNIYDASAGGYFYTYRYRSGPLTIYCLRTGSSAYYRAYSISIDDDGAATIRNTSFSRDIGFDGSSKFCMYSSSYGKKVYIYKKVIGNSDASGSLTSVDEAEINVDLYPNPTKDNVTVEAEGMNHITVFNTLGQIVYDVDMDASSCVLNLAGYKQGLYLVRVVTEYGTSVKRVTVTR